MRSFLFATACFLAAGVMALAQTPVVEMNDPHPTSPAVWNNVKSTDFGWGSIDLRYKKDVQVCLEETAVAALRHDVVLLAKLQLRDNLGTRRALNGVVTPEFQFAVDALNVAVVAEDDRNSLLTRGIEKPCGCGNNSLTTVACERTGDEVVEHVDD